MESKKGVKKVEKKPKKILVPIGAVALATNGRGVLGKPVISSVTTKVVGKAKKPPVGWRRSRGVVKHPIPETQIISLVNKKFATRSTGDGQLKEISPYLINTALPNPIIPVSDLGTATNVREELKKGAQILTPTQIEKASSININIPKEVREKVLRVQQPQAPEIIPRKLRWGTRRRHQPLFSRWGTRRRQQPRYYA